MHRGYVIKSLISTFKYDTTFYQKKFLYLRKCDFFIKSLKNTLIFHCPFIIKRQHFPRLLNKYKLYGAGCEVGVKEGKFSVKILCIWKGEVLYSVDPWRDMTDDKTYIDISNVNQKIQEAFFEEAKERLKKFGDRSKIIRKTSEEAARNLDDDSLDFVYIDARHDYLSVKKDIRTWYLKVKSGGFLCGHDYLNGVLPTGVYDVKDAVDEFARSINRRVVVTCADSKILRSWFLLN